MLALTGRCDDIVIIHEQLEAALTEFKIWCLQMLSAVF